VGKTSSEDLGGVDRKGSDRYVESLVPKTQPRAGPIGAFGSVQPDINVKRT
jgi:hypothetical protein